MPLITLIIWICAEELEDLTKPGSEKDILILAWCRDRQFFQNGRRSMAADWLILLAWMVASRVSARYLRRQKKLFCRDDDLSSVGQHRCKLCR